MVSYFYVHTVHIVHMLVCKKHLVMRSVEEFFVLNMALRMMMYMKYVTYSSGMWSHSFNT